MKRVSIIAIFIIATLLICVSFAFAEDFEEPAIDPGNADYVETRLVTTQLTKDNGYAVCDTNVELKSSSSVNKMVVTVKYIKQSVGIVGTRTATAYRSGVSLSATTKMALTSSGTYHCKVTIKLYNGSTLLETINVITNSVTY